jgi:uncharacterized protein (TIGR04141 family)
VPRAPSPTRRTTVYALRHTGDLKQCITDKYRKSEHFNLAEVSVGGVAGLLITGTIERNEADWCPVLATYTGEQVSLGNRNAVAVLLIPIDARVFAITYGLGFLIIDQGLVEQGFGLRFAIRKLDPARVRAVTRNILEQGARVDRNSVPNGQRVEDFAIEEYGEIISRLAGPSAAEGLTFTRGRSVSFSLKASDSLGLPIGKEPGDLLADLREIARVVDSDPPTSELAFIEQLRAIKTKDPRLPDLKMALSSQLDEPEVGNVALSFPWEGDDDRGDAQTYRLKVPGGLRGGQIVNDIDLAAISTAFSQIPLEDRAKTLTQATIQAFDDEEAESAISRAIPISKWISAEVTLGPTRFFFRDGLWYEVGPGYVDHLHRRVRSILATPSPVTLPAWNADEDEEAYNDRVGREPGFICLDRKLVPTEMHPGRGIELCDLLGPDGELIHVKKAAKSAPLSHLFAQGMVSTEQLLFDEEARTRLAEIAAAEKPGFSLPADWQPRHVVFAIGLKRGLSPDTLFTFSQVVMVRCVDRLRYRQVKVSVVGIQLSLGATGNAVSIQVLLSACVGVTGCD